MKYKLSKIEKIYPIEPPCKKTMYRTKGDAQEAIKYVNDNRGIELNTYQCEICGFWHLTSK